MSIPTIDLRDPSDVVARQLDAACGEIGFVQIVGHGIDSELEHEAWSCAKAFFALSDEAKMAVAIPDGDAYGYGPFQVERLAASRGQESPPDLKETFSIGPFVESGEMAEIIAQDPAAAFAYSPNRWPADLSEMAAVMQRYYDELGALCARLLNESFCQNAYRMLSICRSRPVVVNRGSRRSCHFDDRFEICTGD
jgi:isopenicillin N synthase-like dioxygenase